MELTPAVDHILHHHSHLDHLVPQAHHVDQVLLALGPLDHQVVDMAIKIQHN